MSDKVTCPYDPVHVVERHKLIWHISRCYKSYKGGQHTVLHCPLDYSHVIEAGQLEKHVRSCPQLALAVPMFSVGSDSTTVTGNLRMPQPSSSINHLVTGEWDRQEEQQDDDEDESYDPYDASSDRVSQAATSVTGSLLAWVGNGRGRGRATIAGGIRQPGFHGDSVVEDENAYRPGDTVPGGYTLRDIYYPPGYGGARGRFEERGQI